MIESTKATSAWSQLCEAVLQKSFAFFVESFGNLSSDIRALLTVASVPYVSYVAGLAGAGLTSAESQSWPNLLKSVRGRLAAPNTGLLRGRALLMLQLFTDLLLLEQ